MEIGLRTATVADLNVLAELVSEYYVYDGISYDNSLIRRALLELINDERYGRVWLLELEHQSIGYLVLTYGFVVEFHGRIAVLDEVYIRPNFRAKGYFSAALNFVEAFCRSLKVRCLRLEVERRNGRAQESYRKAGFFEHDRLLMTKLLT
jgi:diamine N-acetyltransferase